VNIETTQLLNSFGFKPRLMSFRLKIDLLSYYRAYKDHSSSHLWVTWSHEPFTSVSLPR